MRGLAGAVALVGIGLLVLCGVRDLLRIGIRRFTSLAIGGPDSPLPLGGVFLVWSMWLGVIVFAFSVR
jgi:hypothetical protein